MTVSIAPAPQHMRALELANRVRLARADLKRRIAEGEVSAAEVVLTCPWEAETMSVSDLLMAQKRWGRTRCRKVLEAVPLTENKDIGKMTERQRRRLAVALESRGALPEPAPFEGGLRVLARA